MKKSPLVASLEYYGLRQQRNPQRMSHGLFRWRFDHLSASMTHN